MKLALGTVQFGLKYGAFNPDGQVGRHEADAILGLASASGISILDTAYEYGSAEESLAGREEFRIITKTRQLKKDRLVPEDGNAVREGFLRSLERLQAPSVYGLMAHIAGDLLVPGGEHVWRVMESLKAEGLVERIGASVYDGAQIDALLARYPVELIQLPINVFDQRLLSGGQLTRLKQKGVEVHARSVFLQGLLLSQPDSLPPYLDRARAPLLAYLSAIAGAGLSPLEAALQFVAQRPEIDEIVVGVLSRAQLAEILAAYGKSRPFDFSRYAVSDEKILNPALWNRA